MDIYDKLRIAIYLSEIIATITGFLVWNKIKNSYWKWFPVFLLTISIIEIMTESMFRLSHNQVFNMNIHVYFGIPLQFIFYLLLFYKYFQGKKESRWALMGVLIYVLLLIVDMVYVRQMNYWFLSFSYTSGNIILLVLIILFFIKLVSSDELMNFKSLMMFWVCVGLLIFYLGSFPLYGMYNTLANRYPRVFNNYWIISSVMDCIMYLFFTLAFIWGKPK